MSIRSARAVFASFVLFIVAAAPPAFPAGPAPAAAPQARAGRAVWLHPGMFGTDREAAVGKMGSTLDAYVRAGIDTIIPCVKTTSGHVYFKSETGVLDPAWTWDVFDELYREARARGIDVHPWYCVFNEEALAGTVRQHPEWLIRDPQGLLRGTVSPALPEARAYERGLMLELARRYPDLGWIHLDYIRFPCDPVEPWLGYDRATLDRFKSDTGADLAAQKSRDSGNPVWNQWLEWNRGQVTAFVRELRAELDRLRPDGPKVRISAAVFPDADNARVLIGQDWAAWARDGLLDMLCPMLYTNDEALFRTLAARAVEAGRGRCPVLPGIGIGTSHNKNTPDGMARQMEIARGLGADGVVFFSGYSLTKEFLERLESLR